jgi:hypothetical protein
MPPGCLCLAPLGFLPGIVTRAGSGDRGQLREGPQDRVRAAVGKGGQEAGVDGAEAAPGDGEVSAQVGEAQVVGGGQPSHVGIGGLCLAGTRPDRERGLRPCGAVTKRLRVQLV